MNAIFIAHYFFQKCIDFNALYFCHKCAEQLWSYIHNDTTTKQLCQTYCRKKARGQLLPDANLDLATSSWKTKKNHSIGCSQGACPLSINWPQTWQTPQMAKFTILNIFRLPDYTWVPRVPQHFNQVCHTKKSSPMVAVYAEIHSKIHVKIWTCCPTDMIQVHEFTHDYLII